MSASAIDRRLLRTGVTYVIVALLCAVAGGVYECFSHGVWSGFMVYAFLFPLSLGARPFGWMALRGGSQPRRWTCNFHHAGVATLTVGSFFEGALAIYGTTNRLTIVYWIAGIALLAGGVIVHMITRNAS